MRSFATTAMSSPHSFVLDRHLFNQTLYSDLIQFWFASFPASASTPTADALKRWFRVGASDAEIAQLDSECRTRFAPALESIGPDHLLLPPFQSYDDDAAHASALAAPFLAEISHAQSAPDTLLALLLLLDQMPRNLYRDPPGLRRVYAHYDRLTFALHTASAALRPSPLASEAYRYRIGYRQWFWVPLTHTEHLPAHDALIAAAEVQKEDARANGDEEAVKYLEEVQGPNLRGHRAVIERFGRFPHRNEALGREDTEEEAEYLKTADTYGVKQTGKREGKVEL